MTNIHRLIGVCSAGLIGVMPHGAAVVAATPEIVLQISHAEVESADISPDGKLLVTGSRDGTIAIWDIEKSQRLRSLQGHRKPVSSVAFAADGSRLISIADQSCSVGGRDHSVLLRHHPAVVWDVVTGEMLQTFDPGSEGFTAAVFHPDGDHFLAGEPTGLVRLWNVNSGKPIRSFQGHDEGEVSCVCVGNDGRYAVTASWDHRAICWDLASGRAVQSYPGGTCASIDADAKAVLTERSDATGYIAVIRNAESGNELQRFVAERPIMDMALSPDGTQAILSELTSGVGSPFRARLYSVESGKSLGEVRSKFGIAMVKFAHGRAYVLSGDLKLTDISSGKCVCNLGDMRAGGCRDVVFSPDSTEFATAHFCWDAESGRALHPLSHGAHPWAMSADRRILLAGRQQAALYEASTGECVYRDTGHDKAVTCGDLSPDQHLAMTGSADGTVRIWERTTGRLQAVLSEQKRETSIARAVRLAHAQTDGEHERVEKPRVDSCRFSHDSQRVLTGSEKAVTISDVSGATIASLEIQHDVSLMAPLLARVAFRDDDQQVLAGYHTGTIYLWSARTFNHEATLKVDGWRLFFVDYLPGGRQIITGCWDGTATIWDLATQRPLRTIKQLSLSSMAVSADGQKLLTGSTEGHATLWNLNSGERLVDFYSFNWGNEWLAVTPEGYHDGSPAARNIVMRRKRRGMPDLEACPDLHRPDLIASALR